jgi:hypothetical protein
MSAMAEPMTSTLTAAANRRPAASRSWISWKPKTTFVDTCNNNRQAKLLLKPVQTVINGVPFGRPYQSPFAVRWSA